MRSKKVFVTLLFVMLNSLSCKNFTTKKGHSLGTLTPEERAYMAAIKAEYEKMPDTHGTGAYPAIKEMDPRLENHVIYRPKDLSKIKNGKLGVVGWGNGRCLNDGASSRLYLAEIASYGYVVVAPGGIHSGPGSTPLPPPPADEPKFGPWKTSTLDVKAGIEWLLEENKRPNSPYYGKINPEKLAVAGYSCGGSQAIELASDPRIKAVIMQNSGVFKDGVNPYNKVNKSMLLKLHSPILYILGGPKDIAYKNGMDDFARISQVPVIVINNDYGHGNDLLKQNGGPSAKAAVAWLEWQLRDDKKAREYFLGKDCGICADKNWTIERKNFP